MNLLNRPSVIVPLGVLSASGEEAVFYAQKKVRIKSAVYAQNGVISASGVNYLSFDMKKNDVALGNAVDTQAGLAKGVKLELLAEELVLEKGDFLVLAITETGTFAEGASAILAMDVEVIGN